MLNRTIKDREVLPMQSVCNALKTNPDTLHSIKRRYGLLPKPIVVSNYGYSLADPFKRRAKGREVKYSGRTIEYFERIKELKAQGMSYADIAKRKDIQDERRLIELLHEANLQIDPFKKAEDFFKNLDILIGYFSRKMNGSEIAHYARLSKDAASVYKEYELVNRAIEDRGYAGNFNIDDLRKKKKLIANRLSLLYEMMKVIYKKMGDLAEKDSDFRKGAVEIIRKEG